mmetsp:Transcript_4863/g.8629  ORF Transcript_4863/g.8629 Transcript_4863/m.8629 type:complete len:238 (+) Transcript_4863:180-893(+)
MNPLMQLHDFRVELWRNPKKLRVEVEDGVGNGHAHFHGAWIGHVLAKNSHDRLQARRISLGESRLEGVPIAAVSTKQLQDSQHDTWVSGSQGLVQCLPITKLLQALVERLQVYFLGLLGNRNGRVCPLFLRQPGVLSSQEVSVRVCRQHALPFRSPATAGALKGIASASSLDSIVVSASGSGFLLRPRSDSKHAITHAHSQLVGSRAAVERQDRVRVLGGVNQLELVKLVNLHVPID